MKTKARIQRFRRRQIFDMVTSERAVLPCGCSIFVGYNAANKVTTGAMPCSAKHESITDRSTGLLREEQAHPRPGRLLVEVCAEVLTSAAREFGA